MKKLFKAIICYFKPEPCEHRFRRLMIGRRAEVFKDHWTSEAYTYWRCDTCEEELEHNKEQHERN